MGSDVRDALWDAILALENKPLALAVISMMRDEEFEKAGWALINAGPELRQCLTRSIPQCDSLKGSANDNVKAT